MKRNAPARTSKQRRIEWPHAISVLLAIRYRRNAEANNKKNTKKKERKNKQRYPVNFKHIFFYHSFFSIEFTVVLCSDDNLKAPARSHLHAYTIMCGVNFRTPSLNPQKNNREVIFFYWKKIVRKWGRVPNFSEEKIKFFQFKHQNKRKK